jgi:hypothetical protein
MIQTSPARAARDTMVPVAALGDLTLFELPLIATGEWRNFKLVRLRSQPSRAKCNWWIAWNGRRLARNHDAGELRRHLPDVYEWAIATIRAHVASATVDQGRPRRESLVAGRALHEMHGTDRLLLHALSEALAEYGVKPPFPLEASKVVEVGYVRDKMRRRLRVDAANEAADNRFRGTFKRSSDRLRDAGIIGVERPYWWLWINGVRRLIDPRLRFEADIAAVRAFQGATVREEHNR